MRSEAPHNGARALHCVVLLRFAPPNYSMKRKSCGAGLRCAPPHARPGEPLARLLRVGFRLSRAPMDTVLFARMLHVNVEAPFWLAQAAFPTMKQQRYGRIVLTTSGRA